MARLKFMNTEIDNLTMEETLQAIDSLIKENKNAYDQAFPDVLFSFHLPVPPNLPASSCSGEVICNIKLLQSERSRSGFH